MTSTENDQMSPEDWEELQAIRRAINDHPASVHPAKMERFTELFVQTLVGKFSDRNP